MTGSGKTTFISKVTGRTDLQIGHGLASCTQEIQVIETKLDGRTVYFIDTPGFSDTHLSDSEILGMIADYLAIAYSQETHLSGIIYLHPISDKRVTHHTIKNLNMFRKLTGDKKLKNVVMATSMWDGDVREEYVEREKELKAKFWDVMISFGAKYSRHDGTVSSAKQIAAMLVKNKPFVLQLQKEMGEDKKTLKDTTAGQEVMNELSRMREQHKAELAAMGDMLRQSSAEQNETAIATLTEHYNRILREIEKTLEDERRMNKDSARRIADLEEKLREKSSCSVM
ncbi:P-loop containing nucleoside triphosphate hydrolase protein [Hypomontagnella monticulosa]|nr:P-loop containing nucleoside triphosphate hydrolase protein [Hypomontagnella monticulosa]